MSENLSQIILSYDTPYVHKTSFFRTKPLPFLPDVLDIPEELYEQSQVLIQFLLEWMSQRGAVTFQQDSQGIPWVQVNTKAEVGPILYAVTTVNFSQLIYDDCYESVTLRFQDNDVRNYATDAMSLVRNIHIQFPETLVNLLINKIYRGYASIVQAPGDRTWDEVHAGMPFLWVFLYMQSIIYRFGNLQLTR